MGHKSFDCPNEGQEAPQNNDAPTTSGAGGWTSTGGDAGAWGDNAGGGAGAWDSVQPAAPTTANEWDSSANTDAKPASGDAWNDVKPQEAASGDAWSNV